MDTRRVIEDLGLQPLRTTTIQHAGGTSMVNIYLVNLTTLSFRIPSTQEIDFVPPAQEYNILKTGNRHDRRVVSAKQRKKR